jgi:hypothetical protein
MTTDVGMCGRNVSSFPRVDSNLTEFVPRRPATVVSDAGHGRSQGDSVSLANGSLAPLRYRNRDFPPVLALGRIAQALEEEIHREKAAGNGIRGLVVVDGLGIEEIAAVDGKIVVGESGKDKEALRYDAITDHGRIGQRFHTASDYAIELLTEEQLQTEKLHHFQQYIYEVVDRFDNGDVLIVLIQYVEREAVKGQRLDNQIT